MRNGVLIEVEGDPDRIEAFVARLPVDAPPLASVEETRTDELTPTGEDGFVVASSVVGGDPDALVSADAATCADCLAELLRPPRSPIPLSVPQLHQLRPPLHDRP